MSRDSHGPFSCGKVVRISCARYRRERTEDDEVVSHLLEMGTLEDFEVVLHFALIRKKHEAITHPQQAS